MKTLLLGLTYAVGIGNLVLAVYFWVTNSKSEIRKVVSLVYFSTALWAISYFLCAYVLPSKVVSFWLYMTFVSGILIVTSLLHFTIIFPYRTIIFDKLHATLLYLPVILFSTL